MCFVNITNLVGNYVGWLSAAAAAILLVAYSRPLRSYWSLRLGLRLEDVELAPLCPLRKISAVRTSHVAPEEVLVPQKRSQVQRIMFVHEPFMMYNIYNYIMHLFIFTLHYINNLDLWLYDIYIYIYVYIVSYIYIHLYLHIYIYKYHMFSILLQTDQAFVSFAGAGMTWACCSRSWQQKRGKNCWRPHLAECTDAVMMCREENMSLSYTYIYTVYIYWLYSLWSSW